jgi:hypothetical protein
MTPIYDNAPLECAAKYAVLEPLAYWLGALLRSARIQKRSKEQVRNERGDVPLDPPLLCGIRWRCTNLSQSLCYKLGTSTDTCDAGTDDEALGEPHPRGPGADKEHCGHGYSP